jgi:hypothetical protein
MTVVSGALLGLPCRPMRIAHSAQPAALLLLLGSVLPSTAHATWPEDVSPSNMTEFGGVLVVDTELLSESYRQLVMELGSMVANKPTMPAETVGVHGFAFDVGTTFMMTEARDRGGEPSPWDRAHGDESAAAYHVIPTMSARKGLPLSTDVGMTAGWIGGSSQGYLSGYGRVAIFEGYRPLPDVSLQAGYGGYIGNDELDVSTLDLGVTVGTTAPIGHLPGINTGQISPWANFTTMRVSANPNLDEDTALAIGAIRYQRSKTEEFQAPIVVPRFGGGVQVTSSNVHLRISASWAPATIPELSTGVGFTF